jgi:hypothetical protein
MLTMLRLHDDKDPVRALGFIALRAADLEDDLAQLVDLLRKAVPTMHKNVQTLPLADQARHARKAFSGLFVAASDYLRKSEDEADAYNILREVENIAERRNTALHSQLIGMPADQIAQINRRRGTSLTITSRELYDLAEDLHALSGGVDGLQFVLGRLLQSKT